MITIFTGHYGSGKTEIALNFALQKGKGTAIVDLDLVNPYFRTKDAESELLRHDIEVITPHFANTNVDVPSLPAEVYSVFQKQGDVIFDVGGDDDGATALGRFKPQFDAASYEMLFVVNAFRPETGTEEGILQMMRAVESASRLKISGLVNNSNIMEYTTKENILFGEKLVRDVAKKTGVPFAFTAAKAEFGICGAFPLKLFLTLPFDRRL